MAKQKYLVCEKQFVRGCDYTIGCGMSYEWIEAESTIEVEEKILWPDGREENHVLKGEFDREEILIIPERFVYKVPVDELREKYAEEERNRFRQEREESEKELLKQLKNKYEKL